METQDITLYINGMHCAGCAKRIQFLLEQAPGVESASVSYRNNTALLHCSGEGVSISDLRHRLQQDGYDLSEAPFRRGSFSVLWPLAAIAALYALLDHFGLLNRLVPSQLSQGTTGYGALFLVGLTTSIHCVAMCGGIGLSQSVAGIRQTAKHWKTGLLYNLGRLISYTLIGTVLGTLGMLLSGLSISLSYTLQGGIKLVVGIAMMFMGLNMLGLVPAISLPRKHLPVSKKLLSPFGIGLLNGFMPCGPLQSMFLLALASGNPLRGGLSMAFFALGTMPLMLGFSSLIGLLGKKYTHTFLLLGSVLICVLGLSMVGQGGALADLFTARQLLAAALLLFGIIAIAQWGKTHFQRSWLPLGAACFLTVSMLLWFLQPIRQSAAAAVLSEDGLQTVVTQLDSGAYPNIQVYAGIPVHWIVQADAENINGCNNRILCQSFDLEYTFHPGDNTITFTPTAPGSYSYSCWMGMISGTITVIQMEETK